MDLRERANIYKQQGYWANATKNEIQSDIIKLQNEIRNADKRTYNGKMTRTFNTAKITIANIILQAINETEV